MKTTRIQLGIEWVRGPLKFQLMMTTVTRMLTVFMMKVNSKYCTHTQSGQSLYRSHRERYARRLRKIPYQYGRIIYVDIEGPLSWFSTFALSLIGGVHIGLAISLAYPSGEEGGILLVLPAFTVLRGRGEGVGTLLCAESQRKGRIHAD
jgi:hypothetical protein